MKSGIAKKLLSVGLVAAMALSLGACGSSDDSAATTTTETKTEEAADDTSAAEETATGDRTDAEQKAYDAADAEGIGSDLDPSDFADEETIVLTAGDSNVEDHPYHKSLVAMNEYLQEVTGGKISLEIYSGGQLGNERELVEQCSMGSVDLIVVSNAPFTNFEKSFTIWDTPYLCDTREDYFKVLDSDFGQEMLDRLSSSGIKGLCYWDASFGNLYANKEVHTPDDMAGMDVRVLESDAYLFAVKALGANPVTIAWNETYTALQNGTVDGAITTPASGFGANLIDVAPCYTKIETLYMALPFVISQSTWDSMDEKCQEAIMDAALYTRTWNRTYTAALEEELDGKMEAAGGTVTTLTADEKQVFVDQVRDTVIEQMLDAGDITQEDLDKVNAALAE